MDEQQYTQLFRAAYDKVNDQSFVPLPFQTELAVCSQLPALLDVPTGLGKTAAAVFAWLYRRRIKSDLRDQMPRRLVYCLPMRVLVEQTYASVIRWLYNLGLLAGNAEWRSDGALERYSAEPGEDELSAGWAKSNGLSGPPIAVHLLLGGEERTDWALWPERDAILIGTQDMLLSRAMNRGYAAGRARWPLEFGFLNCDCLWVFDEIQIMDTGLATSLQFDAWRHSLRLREARDQFPAAKQHHLSRPCHSLWMSATMAQHWLERAVDWSPHAGTAWGSRHQLTVAERQDTTLRSGQLFQITKTVTPSPIAALEKPKTKDGRADKPDAERKQSEYLKRLADHIGKPQGHSATGLTLVIVNTVDRARKLYELLAKQESLASVPRKLIHSRFRPIEREQWSEFLGRKDSTRRILISTQVVEAGVDLSASVLYTELAPWASLVQRFGRCARYPGESGQIIWLDLDLGRPNQPNDHWARPYELSELLAARERLQTLRDGGLQSLTTIKDEIDAETSGEQSKSLFPYEPRFVPHDKDLFDLFDTTPDLTGADVDISRFIRDGEELDIQVFWRAVSSDASPLKRDRPQRRELCPVQFHRFREFLPALRKTGRIWRRNYRKGWELISANDKEQVYPGQIFLLEDSCGGYSKTLGWTGDPNHKQTDLDPKKLEAIENKPEDDGDDSDTLSKLSDTFSEIDAWLTIEEHTRDVCRILEDLLASSGLADLETKVLRLAARIHDWGKAHSAFQAKLNAEKLADPVVQTKLNGQPAAKAPDHAWRKNGPRSGFRHELASALAILEAVYRAKPDHSAFAWPAGLDKASFGDVPLDSTWPGLADDPLMKELLALSADELDLLVYLVAAHHGKVRISLRSSPDDEGQADRQARGVRDGDLVPSCRIPDAITPAVALVLDPMELGLSLRYGASWRERTQLLLERLGPFQLAYLESLLRAADCRASAEEDQRGKEIKP